MLIILISSCLSETFRDSSIPIDDNRLSIPGYSMMRADHPSNTKRGGVCLYYKEHLPIIRRDYMSNLKEWLVTGITVKNEQYFLTCLYSSPSQNCERNWYSGNIGKELDTITSTAGYSQITDKPTHLTTNSSSCIDLTFTSNPSIIASIIVHSGIEKSLCSSCHHDLKYGKINFTVPLPPAHFSTIWDYRNADASSIQHAIENFNWQYAFESKTINEKVQVLVKFQWMYLVILWFQTWQQKLISSITFSLHNVLQW